MAIRNIWRNPCATRPWPEILRHYEGIRGDGFGPMRDFIRRIMESPYVSGLHATTSMHTLVIANTPEFDWGFEVLRIDWERVRDSFSLEFVEEPFVTRRWKRRVNRQDGYATLERFLKRKRWFIEYVGERPD